jgi:hypothetical protein
VDSAATWILPIWPLVSILLATFTVLPQISYCGFLRIYVNLYSGFPRIYVNLYSGFLRTCQFVLRRPAHMSIRIAASCAHVNSNVKGSSHGGNLGEALVRFSIECQTAPLHSLAGMFRTAEPSPPPLLACPAARGLW